MPNGTSHPPQLRQAMYSAIGAFFGAGIAVVIIIWVCGCPCAVR